MKKSKQKVVLAADHAGFELKESLKKFLVEKGYIVIDVGAHVFKKDDDYPLYMAKAARVVQKNPKKTKAIILGGSGQGEAMAANRFKKVRAAVYYGGDSKIISLSRKHNDANMLSLGARFLSGPEAKRAVTLWLKSKFSGAARHRRRITRIENIF